MSQYYEHDERINNLHKLILDSSSGLAGKFKALFDKSIRKDERFDGTSVKGIAAAVTGGSVLGIVGAAVQNAAMFRAADTIVNAHPNVVPALLAIGVTAAAVTVLSKPVAKIGSAIAGYLEKRNIMADTRQMEYNFKSALDLIATNYQKEELVDKSNQLRSMLLDKLDNSLGFNRSDINSKEAQVFDRVAESTSKSLLSLLNKMSGAKAAPAVDPVRPATSPTTKLTM